MPELRWTLLVLGVLFIAALAWWELRRPRQARRNELDRRPSSKETELEAMRLHREPTFTMPELRSREPKHETPLIHDLPVIEVNDDSMIGLRIDGQRVEEEIAARKRVEEPLAVPPSEREPSLDAREEVWQSTLTDSSWPEPAWEGAEPDAVDEATERAKEARPARGADSETAGAKAGEFHGAAVGLAGAQGAAEEEVLSESRYSERVNFDDPDIDSGYFDGSPSETVPAEIEIAPAVSAPSMFDGRISPIELPPVAEPIVDWPADASRQIIAIRLVAPADRFPGRSLRQALTSEGFLLGKFNIFHKPGEDGRAVISAASLTQPGSFDLDSMDMKRFIGLNLFAVTPGPLPPRKAFDELLATARNLNARLQGGLQDDQGQPLTPTRISTIREGLASESPS